MITALRQSLLARLCAQRFHVLIVGGGIVGAGIARDAAMRGLKVALIEQGDFASGTSSKTSKLIHGGLRYLEHGHLRLVCESLRERQILRTIAPAIVHPLSLLIPIYQGNARPGWKINAGLWVYDLLAVGRNIRSHRMLSPRRALALEPGLRLEGLQAAALYADCQMDDARICLANILQAVNFRAVCANYVRLHALLQAGGRVCGGVAEDVASGQSLEIQADVVINATGPWADRVRRLSDSDASPQLAPTKGIHVIVPRLTQEALFVEAQHDRRMLFILPWEEYTLVGTTESPAGESLEALTATTDEVGYLLEETNRIVPGAHLDEDDIVATYAGARPLLAFAGSSTHASREHRIEVDRAGLVSVMGGKFTTYRRMAQEVVDGLVATRRWKADRCLTDQVSLLETVHPVVLENWQEVTRSVDPDLLARLLTRYGAGAFHMLKLLVQDRTLVQPICPHHEIVAAEIVHAMHHEWACTISDVLVRRTHVAFSSCQGLDGLSLVTELFERYGGLSRVQIERQVEEYHDVLAQGQAFHRAVA